MKYTNTKILVIGAGISGIGAARALAKAGANVILSDVKDLSAEKTAALTA
ncbi:MAG: FAD-dependent oxidoreductase, partial [Negativicoccus succinicivorans]|nr:FAD-dependent oxidoreductase [Negativicoccus succinicivorans]